MTDKFEAQRKYMDLAIELARKGAGRVNPNPQVGAVIVKAGRIIGRGYHQKFGELHAERNALKSCEEDPSGADIYVTLEPCCHHGHQPPCTEALIDAGIKRVIVGSRDPNPLVAGKGVGQLKDAGIEVVEDFMRQECDELNPIFFHYMESGTPFVTMKYAMTADGKIATVSGKSKWITGEAARRRVHLDRGRNMGIMCGIGTVLTDNPELTCRYGGGLSPVRIICDTKLKTPLDSGVVVNAGQNDDSLRRPRTIIATCVSPEDGEEQRSKIEKYESMGVTVLTMPQDEDGRVNLRALMKDLGSVGIDSIILEGGGSLNWSALRSGIVNRVQIYIAPKIFGGKGAKSPVSGIGVDSPQDAFKLKVTDVTELDGDYLIESEVVPCSQV